MLGLCSGLGLRMDGKLKWQLVVRAHAAESWDCPVDRFKVHKEQRILQGSQFLAQVRAEPWFPHLHALSGATLNLRQIEVVRYVADGLDAHLLKLFHCTRVDTRQVADMVIGTRTIASVIELARDWIGAVPSRCNVRWLLHGEYGELR